MTSYPEYETVDVTMNSDSISFKDNGGYESRNESCIRMLTNAWKTYIQTPRRSTILPIQPRTITFRIATQDQYIESCQFSYGITGPHQIHRCIPHFVFDKWPQVGIDDYEEMFSNMVTAGTIPPVDPRVFWIGANTNPFRVTACELSKEYPDLMDFRMINWSGKNPNKLYQHTSTYVSLVDHCKYRVLIDLGAGGFSGRLPLLFASGRPVILAKRKTEAWFYWDGTLKPWVHYIPCETTKEDLLRVVQWTFDHPVEAEEIGRQGHIYANTYLTRSSVVQRCGNLLRSIYK